MSGDRLIPLARRYRLLSVVGRGGMGTVWRAYDEMLDRDVAVKEVHLPPRITEGERRVMCRRLLCEARATAALRHPGVVAVHDLIIEDGRPWIVMEFLEACSLHRLVTEDGPLGVRRTAEIGAAVLSVLRASHAAGILHRDVKPSNVLICDDGRVLLGDFGLAVHTGKGPQPADTLLAGIEGSPAYLPPERVNGLPSVEASDLWSLGATLYTAVEGFSPFLRCHALASMVAVLLGDYARPVRAGPLTPVIEGLLRQRPEDRLTAEATAELLQKLIGTLPEPGFTRAPVPHSRRFSAHRVVPRRASRALGGSRVPREASGAPVRRGPRVPWTLRGGGPSGSPPCGSRQARWRVPALPSRRLRPGAVVSVALLAALAAGAGTWTARWTSIGKGDSVALRPAAGVSMKTARYHEAGAYSVRVPAGWQAERRGSVMTWKDAETGRGLRIAPAPGDPLAGLRAEERGAVKEHRYPGYRRLRLEPVPEVVDGAAEWEFTWRDGGHDAVRHVLCGRAAGYEFCFHAPDPEWTPGQRLYDKILKSFRPEKRG
ncbi:MULTISPECIES: serine/threonine-protein kinase [unclassified Actinomadura]|uniref:serine/threonine-protein kinase n=1 Tax=unclassified Actinomadura TaxID=2626254 RepID=UPI0011F07054|nr:serine/threonine-protein kinase [Actinomadura sp. K4S16]